MRSAGPGRVAGWGPVGYRAGTSQGTRMIQGKDKAGRFDHLRGALREFPPLIWSFLYFFFLLTGYYVLRPVRDAMGASADVEAVFPRALVDWTASHGWALGDPDYLASLSKDIDRRLMPARAGRPKKTPP